MIESREVGFRVVLVAYRAVVMAAMVSVGGRDRRGGPVQRRFSLV